MHKTQAVVEALSDSIQQMVDMLRAEGMPVLVSIGVVDEDGDAALAIWVNGPRDATTILQPVVQRHHLACMVLSEPGFDECQGVVGVRRATKDEIAAVSVPALPGLPNKTGKTEDFDA